MGRESELSNSAMKAASPSRGRIVRNAATALAIAWSMRLIGLISVFVLARILTPRDFGIMALAMSAAALVDIFSALGLWQSLLRIQEPERAHYDTAWTIQLLLLLFLAAVLVAMGPVAASFYGEPALTAVIAVLASRFVFYGLVNIGTIDFDRHLELGRDLRLRIAVRLSSFAATVGAAFVLRNYWALVIGAVLQAALHAAGSYLAHPYRPRFSIAKRAELLGVSLWMFLTSAAQTFYREVDQLIVGRIASMQIVGFYSVTKGLSSIFTEEIATALNRVTFVLTAQTGRPLRDEALRLNVMLGAYAMIVAPLGLGLAATAQDACAVLLGPQWTGAATYLQLVAPAATCFAVHKLIVSSLQASGEAKRAAFLAMSGIALLACAAAVALLIGSEAIGLAWAALAASTTLLITGLVVVSVGANAKPLSPLLAVVRPFASALIMMAILRSVDGVVGAAIVRLTADVAGGAAIYVSVAAVLWLSSGRPDGAEAKIAEFLTSTTKQYFGRLSLDRG
jgi:lipopolysaccharide exporter